MRKKKNVQINKLKWKVLLLVLGILLLVGLVILQCSKKEKAVQKKVSVQKEQQEEIQKEEIQEGKVDVPKFGTQKKAAKEKKETVIINLDEYATKLMGENTELLNKRLTEWVEENQLNAKEGSIFHVMVPMSDPQSINFYIRLSDERNSLVMLAYHPRENVVTASICNYTEQEIINEVWEGDNGPAVRDVSPEQDTGGVGQEGAGQEGAGIDDIAG